MPEDRPHECRQQECRQQESYTNADSQDRPDIVVILTDQERAIPPYENDALSQWRHDTLTGRRWFDEHGVSFERHYTGSLACVPSRPTLFTGQFPDVHGVTQTNGLGKMDDDSRMRWLREGEVPTMGHWFRAGGYDTHYDGKWHISHADLTDPITGDVLATNDEAGNVHPAAVKRYLDADPLDPFGFSGWVGPEPHGAGLDNAGVRRDTLIAARVVAWLEDRYARRSVGDAEAKRPFLLVASFVNPHDIVLFPAWARGNNPLAPSPLDPPDVPPAPTADEDLRTKPAAQIAYRAAYGSGYGPARMVDRLYEKNAQAYRNLYHRLHAEVDGPLDQVRRAVTENGSVERRARAHLRPRRGARRSRRPAPEVAEPVRRGGPRPVRDRSDRWRCNAAGHHRRHADLARRPAPDVAGRRRHRSAHRRRRVAGGVHRVPPAAGSQPVADRRRSGRGRPGSHGLHDDEGQHAGR